MFHLDEEKEIRLKNGYNWGSIFAILFVLVGLVGLITVRLWFPDSRPLMERNNHDSIMFNGNTIMTPQEFYYDEERNLGQITLQRNTKADNTLDLDYKVFWNGTELPIMVSRGVCIIEDEQTRDCMQNILIQFGLPKGFEYVELQIIDPENKMEIVQLDNRNFIHEALSDKVEGYQKNIDTFNVQIIQLQKEKKPYEAEVKGLTDSKKQLEQDINVLNNEIIMLSDEKEIQTKKDLIKVKEQDLQAAENKIAELNTLLSDYDRKIEEIEEQKAEVE